MDVVALLDRQVLLSINLHPLRRFFYSLGGVLAREEHRGVLVAARFVKSASYSFVVALTHIIDMAEHNPLVYLQVRVLVQWGQLCIVLSELLAMSFLGVDYVELGG